MWKERRNRGMKERDRRRKMRRRGRGKVNRRSSEIEEGGMER